MTLAGLVATAVVDAAAAPALVRTIRCSGAGQSARIVIDLSRSLAYSAGMSADSTSYIVEIPGAVSETSLGEVRVGAGGVRRIQVRTLDGATMTPRVQATLELDARISCTHFRLPAEHGKPARIVLDVTRRGPLPAIGVTAADDTTPAPALTTAEPAPDDTASRIESRAAREPFVVAIDAGHGGHDTGTLGLYGLMEKKLVLDIARRIAADINRRPGLRAVLTRDDDVFLTLPQRNEIAEKLGADVFVSIHLNSAPSRSARGAEIFFVAPAGAERAANNVLNSGEAAHEFGLDRQDDADIVHMLLDVNQQSVLARSESLAAAILEEVRDSDLLPTRNVKQKSFSVLRTISMPSVLVEGGFVTNSADAKMLKSESGRARLASVVSAGIQEFLRTNPPQRKSASMRQIVHKVQNGDTLWTIAKLYNVPVQRICELNGFGTSQPLRVGQEIVVER
ncbi:MAG TPA: N-acetylmuramoyl-L-alanine amidase [Candidatus Krumholzibacteria bacterium]